MQNFTPKGNWKMAAILGLDDENVEEICKNISSGFVKASKLQYTWTSCGFW